MTITERDRRALLLLGLALAGGLFYRYVTAPSSTSAAAKIPLESVPLVEQRLTKVKARSATLKAHQEVLQKVKDELNKREAALIQAETAPQAQAQLLQIVRRVGKKENLDIRGQDLGAVRPFGQHYGEALVTVSFECQVDQLVNFLADLTQQPEAISTEEIHLAAVRDKTKILPVRLTIGGLVPRRLVPEKKGPAAF